MKSFVRKYGRCKTTLAVSLLLLSCWTSFAGGPNGVTIIDGRHYSQVLAEIRNFRVFLPPGYLEHPEKKYPVIYFFHGHSQRYFGSSRHYSDFDKGNENGGDNISNFVAAHDVIVVKADGYNRSPDEEYYVRPYNIGPVETYRQFPLYFPELVAHIDAHYRTVPDREHRAISGLSMGGFMTFWIGGKYPDLVCAAGSFCGSPEFFVGPKDFPVEYRHIDMCDNYAGMNVRLHYGDEDFIRSYHDDINRIWPQLVDNYDFRMYHAAHSTCGLGDMFSFMLETFRNPPPRPVKWKHTDVYPQFSVWDYEVATDRIVPGFTVLDKVDAHGFRCAVRNFLPDGELLPFVDVTVTTPALYKKNQDYVINDFDTRTLKATQHTVQSDASGRLTIRLDGSSHEIGINEKTDKPNISLSSIQIADAPWASTGKTVSVAISVLNKGLAAGQNIRGTVSGIRPSTKVEQAKVSFGDIAVNELKVSRKPFSFRVTADSIEIVRFKLTLQDDHKNEWVEFFDIPVRKEVPEITDFQIADGKVVTVVTSAVDEETVLLGRGNGDGVANPGESIVVLVRDEGKLWRTDLLGSDRQVNPFGVSIRKSDYWGSHDYVGGSAKYDVSLIASDCPQDYELEFLAEYWVPKPETRIHLIRRGVVKFPVRGKDTTPPAVDRIWATGNNVLNVRIREGAPSARVNATLISKDDGGKTVKAELTDDGQQGDRVANDRVFSARIPEQVFGIFNVEAEVLDTFGNKAVQKAEKTFVFH